MSRTCSTDRVTSCFSNCSRDRFSRLKRINYEFFFAYADPKCRSFFILFLVKHLVIIYFGSKNRIYLCGDLYLYSCAYVLLCFLDFNQSGAIDRKDLDLAIQVSHFL